MSFEQWIPGRQAMYVKIRPHKGTVYLSAAVRRALGETFDVYVDKEQRAFGLKPGGSRWRIHPCGWTNRAFTAWTGLARTRQIAVTWSQSHGMLIGEL
jgi:hypothetical protein